VLSIWDVETGDLMHTLSPPEDNSLSITAAMERNEYMEPGETSQVIFAHDGEILISGCPDTSMVCIWSTETWELQHTIRGHWVYLSPNGKFLAVSSDTFRVTRIYETTTWQLHSTLKFSDRDREVFPSTFSPDSKLLATYSGHEIALWDIDSSKVIKTFTDTTRKVSAPVFSLDGRVVMVGARKCGFRIWDVEGGDCLLALQPEDGARDSWNSNGCRGGPPAFEVLFIEGGAKIAVAFPDGSVKIWDVRWQST
ncbi:WD40 repeat-like protein, partial [Aureobasidium namibiae CBS 147.97]